MAVKLTLVALTLLIAIGGFWIAVDGRSWGSIVGAIIPATLLLYMTIRVFRDVPAN